MLHFTSWFLRALNCNYSETFIKRAPSTYPSVRLIEGDRLIEVVKVAQCLLTPINIQRLLCIVIKSHIAKDANEAVLYFLQDLKMNFDRGWQSYGRISV